MVVCHIHCVLARSIVATFAYVHRWPAPISTYIRIQKPTRGVQVEVQSTVRNAWQSGAAFRANLSCPTIRIEACISACSRTKDHPRRSLDSYALQLWSLRDDDFPKCAGGLSQIGHWIKTGMTGGSAKFGPALRKTRP